MHHSCGEFHQISHFFGIRDSSKRAWIHSISNKPRMYTWNWIPFLSWITGVRHGSNLDFRLIFLHIKCIDGECDHWHCDAHHCDITTSLCALQSTKLCTGKNYGINITSADDGSKDGSHSPFIKQPWDTCIFHMGWSHLRTPQHIFMESIYLN